MGKTYKLGGAEAKWHKGVNREEVVRSIRGKGKKKKSKNNKKEALWKEYLNPIL